MVDNLLKKGKQQKTLINSALKKQPASFFKHNKGFRKKNKNLRAKSKESKKSITRTCIINNKSLRFFLLDFFQTDIEILRFCLTKSINRKQVNNIQGLEGRGSFYNTKNI